MTITLTINNQRGHSHPYGETATIPASRHASSHPTARHPDPAPSCHPTTPT